ncbi:MAG: DUF6249 domain-containing protein [Betaproteobacteria bacterium]
MNFRPSPPPLSLAARRIVLGGAVLGALIVAFGPYAPPVQADEGESSTRMIQTLVVAQSEVAKSSNEAVSGAKEAAQVAKDAAKEAAQVAKDAAQVAKDAADSADNPGNITIDRHGIRIEEGDSGSGKRKRVTVGLGGTDREYDSFEQFVHEDRGLAFMVVAIVFVVFLTPVLITGLLIWYKLRKNRMLNDTMVQLAEKGLAPTAEMLQALQSGRTVAAATAVAARASVIDQVKTLRTQAAWSDLRKGVILAALGLSFVAYSMFDDRSPNWIGLVLLFLGIGYGFLWYFEDRQLAAPASVPPPPPAGGV